MSALLSLHADVLFPALAEDWPCDCEQRDAAYYLPIFCLDVGWRQLDYDKQYHCRTGQPALAEAVSSGMVQEIQLYSWGCAGWGRADDDLLA